MLNEESVVAFCLLSVFYGIFKYGGPMYNDWAAATTDRIKGILDTAKKGHAEAVKSRIEDVKPLSNVVDITQGLFEVSKVWPFSSTRMKQCINVSRKPPNSKPKPLSFHNAPPSPLRPSMFSTPGSDMKVNSKSASREN